MVYACNNLRDTAVVIYSFSQVMKKFHNIMDGPINIVEWFGQYN